jgi:hypothetical protein
MADPWMFHSGDISYAMMTFMIACLIVSWSQRGSLLAAGTAVRGCIRHGLAFVGL